MPGSPEPCPCETSREFSRVSAVSKTAAGVRTNAPASEARALPGTAPGSFVGSQSRWAGSEIPRRARVSGTHRQASLAQPGKTGKSSLEAVRRESQGRCRSPRSISLAKRDTRPALQRTSSVPVLSMLRNSLDSPRDSRNGGSISLTCEFFFTFQVLQHILCIYGIILLIINISNG